MAGRGGSIGWTKRSNVTHLMAHVTGDRAGGGRRSSSCIAPVIPSPVPPVPSVSVASVASSVPAVSSSSVQLVGDFYANDLPPDFRAVEGADGVLGVPGIPILNELKGRRRRGGEGEKKTGGRRREKGTQQKRRDEEEKRRDRDGEG